METAGVARLTCPYRVSKRVIEQFLADRKEWLLEQNLEMEKWAPWALRSGKEGEIYLYLGDELTLKDAVTVLKKPFVAVTPAEGPFIYHFWPESQVAERHEHREEVFINLRRFFTEKAEAILLERAEGIAQQMSLRPQRIRFRSQRMRWGSCSSSGHISLNRRLIGAPLWVIDCVLIHEFAHLVHLDHSPAFWKIVEEHAPNYAEADRWLNQNQYKLL